jgi:hypothetical protein
MSDRQSAPGPAQDAVASLRDPRRDRARRVAELLGVTLMVPAPQPPGPLPAAPSK